MAGIRGSLATASVQWLAADLSVAPSLQFHRVRPCFVQQTVGDSTGLHTRSLLSLLINHVCCSPAEPRYSDGLSVSWFSVNLPRIIIPKKRFPVSASGGIVSVRPLCPAS